MIGLVKRALKNSWIAGSRLLLSERDFLTLLIKAEAAINLRPLIYVGSDLKDRIICPANFLMTNPVSFADMDPDSEDIWNPNSANPVIIDLAKHLGRCEKKFRSFWDIWRCEYLTSLRERSQREIRSPRSKELRPPTIGDVVLIKGAGSRVQWPVGKIVELERSRDGKIRVAMGVDPFQNVGGTKN